MKKDGYDIQLVTQALPQGFELLRHAAAEEAYNMLARLKAEWDSGDNRFDRPGEALVAAYSHSMLVGMGGMNIDPHLTGALRMRRFYVIPARRRRGVATRIAESLLNRPDVAGRIITLNAPRIEAARFWEALGFLPESGDGYTHVRRSPYIHA